jgi:carboxypeptidase T
MHIIKHLAILTVLFLLVSQAAFSHQNSNLTLRKGWTLIANIHSNNFSKALKDLSDHDIDIAGVDVKNKIIDVLVDDIQYHFLKRHGYKITISETKGVTRRPDKEYKNPEEIEILVKNFNARFPDLTKLISIGKSLEGRDIWAIKISDNANVNENSEPAVLFNSMHHAREIMTPEVSIDIIEYLLTNYNSDPKVTSWVNETEIWVIPMFNVDGNNKMWNDDAWWRKNVRGGYGVDLNRNYPAGWGSCNGSSGSKRSQTYRGPNPASEPETQAMMGFIQKVRPVFDISYHSYSELVLYPYGCGKKRTQTKEIVETIGKKVAGLLNYEPGTPWELLYNADGGDIDWMYEAYQVIPYVIELNSSRQGFHPRYKKWRDKTVVRNRVGWQYLLDRVQQSGVRGMIMLPSGQAINNFTLKVYKLDNGQKSFFQDYKGHTTGMYHLVLNPGKYEIEVHKDNKSIAKSIVNIKADLEVNNIEVLNY